MRAIIAAFFIAPLVGMAQTAVKFEATTQLVVVNVSARDKSGEPMIGLRAADFTVTEDGKAQQIKVFEYQRLDDTVLGAPGLTLRGPESAAAAAGWQGRKTPPAHAVLPAGSGPPSTR